MEEAALIGEPTFVEIDGDRFRCVETGHEMLDFERERYGASKKCRDALFDRALEEGRVPLNFFDRRLEYRDKIVCKLTGAVVNKNEQAVWKHVLGKSFQRKLSSQEKKKSIEKSSKQDKAHIMEDGSIENDYMDFWMPPEADSDDGETESGREQQKKTKKEREVEPVDGSSQSQRKAKKKTESAGQKDAQKRMKRLALAVGPSSFASRKKKRKMEKLDWSKNK